MQIKFEDKIFKIRESIDVYLSSYGSKVKIQFYKINTREKISIEASDDVAKFVANIDGVRSIREIYSTLNLSNLPSESIMLMDFLCSKNIVVDNSEFHKNSYHNSSKFIRQTSFFEDWINVHDGGTAQQTLEGKKVSIFGTGAVGSAIAILLARAGISKFTLVDPKRVRADSQARHFFFRSKYIGMYKVEALADYIKSLNSGAKIDLSYEKILPETDLASLVNDADIVINTADEPYIGHINLKIGRYLWPMNIAMYAAGGFDAHLMSTGELIIPQRTPCIDCYMNTFRKSLAGWKPTYSEPVVRATSQENDLHLLSSGGLAQMSLFSASYAAVQIIQYLLDAPFVDKHISRRGECLFNHAKMTWFHMAHQGDCDVCAK